MRTLVRVISLVGSARRDGFHRPPDELGLDWAFLDASTGLAEGLRFDAALSWLHMRRVLVQAEIGVYASHVRAWRTLLAHPEATQMLVLEDDVYADWRFLRDMTGIDWSARGVDYLKFFGKQPARYRMLGWHDPVKDRHLVQYITPPMGLQAYLVTRRAAAAFERRCRVVSRPVDVELERPWATGIPVVGIVPHAAIELSIPSSIRDREANRTASRAELARYFAGRVREHARARTYRWLGPRVRLMPAA